MARRLDYTRADLTTTRVLVLVLTVLTPVLALVLPLVSWARGEALETGVDLGRSAPLPSALAQPVGDATLRWTGGALVRLPHASAGTWFVHLLPAWGLSIMVVVAGACVLRLLGLLARDSALTYDCVAALHLLAFTVGAGAVLVALLGTLSESYVADQAVALDAVSVTVVSGGQVLGIVVGLVIAALAEMVARGVRLQVDVEGLI